MRNWNVMLLVAALTAGPALASDTSANPSTVSATGEGGWEVICHVNTGGGDDTVRILNSGKSSFSLAAVRGASCSFTKPGKAALTILIQSSTLRCPFKSAESDACKQTFEKGAAGSFDLKPKPAP